MTAAGPVRFTVAGAVAAVLITGCGGPRRAAPPSNAEAVTAFRGEFITRLDAVAAAPGTAARELDLAIESLTGYAESQGEPFRSWLETAKEIRSSWGSRPTPAQVADGLGRMRKLLQSSP
jgi:hypothetical protein